MYMYNCSCMAIIITGKNTMTLSRSVRHIVKHIHIQDFFFGHADFPNWYFFNLDAILHIHCIYILINIVWMCSAILTGYIYMYTIIHTWLFIKNIYIINIHVPVIMSKCLFKKDFCYVNRLILHYHFRLDLNCVS